MINFKSKKLSELYIDPKYLTEYSGNFYPADQLKYPYVVHKGRVYDSSTKTYPIANATLVDKARFQRINGNDFYSGNLNPHTRVKIVEALKIHLKPYFVSFTRIPNTNLPVKIAFKFYDTPLIDGKSWDIDNRSYLYVKVTFDLLKELNLIESDDTSYISGYSVSYVQSSDSKLIIEIL